MGPRLASLLYECLLVFAVAFIGACFYYAAIHPIDGPWKTLFQAYLFAIIGAYFSWCWIQTGQTLPMKTWRLRLVTVEGAPLSPPRAVLRYSLAWLSLLPAGLGFFWAIIDGDRQFLHDRLARTRIVAWEK